MKELRNIENADFRAYENEDKKFIEGYGFLFNSESKDLGGFIEVIERSSIENVDMSNVTALFNHNNNYVLARKNGDVNTLELEIDEIGLRYKFEVDMEISYQKDLYRNMLKGNISKSSFAFYLPQDGSGERWEKRGDKYYRHITKFARISDVSVVTNPAYDQTVSLARSFDSIKEELTEKEITLSNKEELIYKYHKLKK
jgi:HK97 family phage prohead protease